MNYTKLFKLIILFLILTEKLLLADKFFKLNLLAYHIDIEEM